MNSTVFCRTERKRVENKTKTRAQKKTLYKNAASEFDELFGYNQRDRYNTFDNTID